MWSFVCDLDDSKTTFAVKLRLVRAYAYPSFTNREEIASWECILHDEKGDRIEATIPKFLIAKFKDQMEEGLVYGIKKFKVVHNSKKYKVTANKYKIILTKDTKIHELFVQGFPMKIFCFKSFEEVQLKENLYNGSVFDIIGVLVHSGEVQERTKNGEQKKLIELTLEDTEGGKLYCTLWENYVDEFLKFYEREKQGTNIIIVQFCKSSIFNGIFRACNIFNVTKLLMNADILEINDFRQRIATKSSLSTSNNISISQGTTSSLSDEFCDGMIKIKTIEDLFDDDESAWVIATIDRIDCSYGWSYLSCKRCTKKLIKEEHQFYCKGCNAYDSSATLRYKLKVRVKDDTGRAPFLVWDRECKQVIGKTAAELENNSEGEGVDNLPKDIVITMLNQKFLFKVDGYNVSKLITDEKVISTYSTSCLDSQESNCISRMEGSNVMKDKVEDDILMETPSSKGVGDEWRDDEQVKRSLDDAFSATEPQKKRIVNIKKEKI